MAQRTTHDSATAEYAVGLESVWAHWEPALRNAERLLHAGTIAVEHDPDHAIEQLRRAQYRAHTTGEFVSGLQPPVAAADAHSYLAASLEACRDTLGVLASHVEDDELDDITARIGLQSVSSTRDAFDVARTSGTTAWHLADAIEPMWMQSPSSTQERRVGMVLWGLVCVCALLFGVLLVEVLVLDLTH